MSRAASVDVAAHRDRRKFKKVTDRNIFEKVVERMREWFGEIF